MKKGQKMSEEQLKRMSECQKGKILSMTTKRKISESNKGRSVSEETKIKISEGMQGNKHTLGHHHTEETKIKISKAQSGDKSCHWKGGVSFEPYCVKFNKEFRERVRAFFGYQCVECGTPQNGTKLDVHHVNSNKKACCDSTIPLFVSLCHTCHSKTQFNREYWESHFTEIINNYYQGRSYLTQEEMMQLGGG